MKKYFLIFAIFLSFFYLFQNADALDYKCDSRPNNYGSPCSERASACDYSIYKGSFGCTFSDCPAGTVLVDCPVGTGGNYANCINLQCGDAGTPSGNTCVLDSSIDSDCITTTLGYTYGWTDNTAPLSCTCYDSASKATKSQYTKKADRTACTASDGSVGECTRGKCTTAPYITCTSQSLYNGNPSACAGAGYYYCASPSTPSDTCVSSSSECTGCVASLTFPKGTSDPCTVSGTVAATGCNGKTYHVKDSSSTDKCSGSILTNDEVSKSCSIFQTGTASYALSVGSDLKDTKSAECTVGSTPSGSSDYDCAWCPNSYNGKTSANGGECMKAMDLAAQCGGCYVASTYIPDANYRQWCFSWCPSSTGTYGYYG